MAANPTLADQVTALSNSLADVASTVDDHTNQLAEATGALSDVSRLVGISAAASPAVPAAAAAAPAASSSSSGPINWITPVVVFSLTPANESAWTTYALSSAPSVSGSASVLVVEVEGDSVSTLAIAHLFTRTNNLATFKQTLARGPGLGGSTANSGFVVQAFVNIDAAARAFDYMIDCGAAVGTLAFADLELRIMGWQ